MRNLSWDRHHHPSCSAPHGVERQRRRDLRVARGEREEEIGARALADRGCEHVRGVRGLIAGRERVEDRLTAGSEA
jgi:hypothetical protein